MGTAFKATLIALLLINTVSSSVWLNDISNKLEYVKFQEQEPETNLLRNIIKWVI